jgi:hypothetical protein
MIIKRQFLFDRRLTPKQREAIAREIMDPAIDFEERTQLEYFRANAPTAPPAFLKPQTAGSTRCASPPSAPPRSANRRNRVLRLEEYCTKLKRKLKSNSPRLTRVHHQPQGQKVHHQDLDQHQEHILPLGDSHSQQGGRGAEVETLLRPDCLE